MDIFELYKQLKKTGDWAKPVNLRQTRKKLYGMTQAEFADLLGISYKTYINWEQGRFKPCTPSQALLHMATCHKDIFLKDRELFLKKLGDFKY
jgi:DNA-binding transcriptional regulator YiaG